MTDPILDRDLEKNRKRIEAFLERFFRSPAAGLAAVNSWGADFTGRILPFVSGGKMIRGGLSWSPTTGSDGKAGADAVKAAAAMELFHSAFLIHDDIMDDDPLRRGKPSIHVQYRDAARRKGLADAAGFGRAAALCAGDVLIFMGLEILASLESPAAVKSRVLALFGRELAHVGPAQVQDVYSGKTRRPVSRDDIFRLYTYKTARYTYSLPLSAGALLAGAGTGRAPRSRRHRPRPRACLPNQGRRARPVRQRRGDGQARRLRRRRREKNALLSLSEPGPRAEGGGLLRPRPARAQGNRPPQRPPPGRKKSRNGSRGTSAGLPRRCERRIRAAALPAGMKAALADLLAMSLGTDDVTPPDSFRI